MQGKWRGGTVADGKPGAAALEVAPWSDLGVRGGGGEGGEEEGADQAVKRFCAMGRMMALKGPRPRRFRATFPSSATIQRGVPWVT